MKKLFLSMIFLTTTATAVFYVYYQKYQIFLNTNVFVEDTIINISKGQNFKGFTESILVNNANGKEWQWRLFARLENVGQWLKVGEFMITSETTPMQMMQKINNNQVITYQFTIVEGQNWRELKEKMRLDTNLIHSISDFDDEQLLNYLDLNYNSLEGLFLPETYQFVKGGSDLDILKRANKDLTTALQTYWQERKPNLPFINAYEMLIMASIVEKETALAKERNTIAGVFVRRLQLNMRLQTDPTVIYGLGIKYDGDIKSKDLSTDTPYNTYTRKGLPPTPIAMASLESIMASAHPQEGKELYFVANNRGGHYFSDTYAQHQKAVKNYLKGKKL